jgi:galacturonosyltransferase
LSNSLLEAASCGRMLITTNIPGCREVVINNKTGYVIEKKNTEQIIDALERTIKLNHEDITLMGLEGRKHIEKIYEKSKVVDLTLHYIFKENRDEL